jgi:hypothetical protein
MKVKAWDVERTARDGQFPASDYYRRDDERRCDQRPQSGLQQPGNPHSDNGTERVECLQPADALAPFAFRCELHDEKACYGVGGPVPKPTRNAEISQALTPCMPAKPRKPVPISMKPPKKMERYAKDRFAR